MIFTRTYRTRAEELADAIALGRKRFLESFGYLDPEYKEEQKLAAIIETDEVSESDAVKSDDDSDDSGIVPNQTPTIAFKHLPEESPSLSHLTLLKINLLKVYNELKLKKVVKKDGATLELQFQTLKMLLNRLNRISANVDFTEEQISAINQLFSHNDVVRRQLMLFKEECPEKLKQVILKYELNKCYQGAWKSAKKQKAIKKLEYYLDSTDQAENLANFHYSDNGETKQASISPEEWALLNQGRTGRFLQHFFDVESLYCANAAEIVQDADTPAFNRTFTQSVDSQFGRTERPSINERLKGLYRVLQSFKGEMEQCFIKINNEDSFIEKFVGVNNSKIFSNGELHFLFSNPDTSFFIENNWDDLGNKFKQLILDNTEINVNYSQIGGLVALTEYEAQRKSTQTASFFYDRKLWKKAGVALLKDYCKTGTCTVTDPTKTDVIKAMEDGDLHKITRIVGGFKQLKKCSTSFKGCHEIREGERERDNQVTRASIRSSFGKH